MSRTETWVQTYGQLANSTPGPDGEPLSMRRRDREFRELLAVMQNEVWRGPQTRTTRRADQGITQRWERVR